MKFDINLYHKEFHPKFEVYTSANLAIVTLFALALGIVGGVLISLHKSDIQNQIAANQREIDRYNTQIKDFNELIANRTGSPVLAARLQRLTTELNAQRQLMNELKSLTTVKQKSFSDLFLAFSQSASNQLWLTGFTVTPVTLEISGNTSNPQALPMWIGQLNKTQYFQGQEFSSTAIQKVDNVWQFSLLNQTQPEINTAQAETNNNSQPETNAGFNDMESSDGF